ncbi:hypothetical protein OPV22_004826 [Ensete ventricosum]|uniref:Small ribosomal subunit protein eS21 n=1 Tax=Ensete ventricosum TaxID=4639 RepID=A0AAV8RQ75_ENSVE|nr:hypothetical protein OPV22_004826 [Ensete ventricosum]
MARAETRASGLYIGLNLLGFGVDAALLRFHLSPQEILPARELTGKMQNEAGEMTDLYIPRKCSATNRLITAKDHASVQINIGHLDESGVYTGQFTTFALSGFIRAQGDADSALDRLWQKKKVEVKQQ